MKQPFFHSERAVTLIGAGTVCADRLALARSLAPVIVSADGGTDAALAHGLMPEAVVGDMDSISAQARAKLPAQRICQISEQDSTDFDKALRNIAAPLVIGVGFEGDRIDHMLACYSVLVQRHVLPCVLLSGAQIVFHAPPDLALDLAPGTLVSLFPMARVSGRSTGLKWPVDGLEMAPNGRVGTSNRATGPVRLQMDGPGMLVILPVETLPLVAKALAEPNSSAR
ncbi:thiamine diphosphokinase [Thalassovita sp.]|jgi:thiamine pyrophosphokinase|uniref:thiamine diphosphokinase n=1 Tax=Thalassovita sp. TaxID=1979401 RepID=UPI003B5937F6